MAESWLQSIRRHRHPTVPAVQMCFGNICFSKRVLFVILVAEKLSVDLFMNFVEGRTLMHVYCSCFASQLQLCWTWVAAVLDVSCSCVKHRTHRTRSSCVASQLHASCIWVARMGCYFTKILKLNVCQGGMCKFQSFLGVADRDCDHHHHQWP